MIVMVLGLLMAVAVVLGSRPYRRPALAFAFETERDLGRAASHTARCDTWMAD